MLNTIRAEFFAGKIKTQNLETEIFTRVYGSAASRVADACRDAARFRCELVEERTGKRLSSIKNASIDTCALAGGECILAGIESKMGGAVIPMGFAGPAKIHGKYVSSDEDIYIPLATNEAALVAGVQRGLKAITLAGGLKTLVHFDGSYGADRSFQP